MESEGVKKKNSDGIPQTLSDDEIYEDGIDERPSVKESDDYNDDEFDY